MFLRFMEHLQWHLQIRLSSLYILYLYFLQDGTLSGGMAFTGICTQEAEGLEFSGSH